VDQGHIPLFTTPRWVLNAILQCTTTEIFEMRLEDLAVM
jgi:hypothetical protein